MTSNEIDCGIVFQIDRFMKQQFWSWNSLLLMNVTEFHINRNIIPDAMLDSQHFNQHYSIALYNTLIELMWSFEIVWQQKDSISFAQTTKIACKKLYQKLLYVLNLLQICMCQFNDFHSVKMKMMLHVNFNE
jgi:hypothetical protein